MPAVFTTIVYVPSGVYSPEKLLQLYLLLLRGLVDKIHAAVESSILLSNNIPIISLSILNITVVFYLRRLNHRYDRITQGIIRKYKR